ncbi:MAG: ATP-dependent helicase HrpB, partial [Desulfobulbaceae bacterium]|nr:ATP-dependent helicase HrpB [Desulfobulbaceae bacterium]
QCVGQIVIEEIPLANPDPDGVRRAVLEGVRLLGLDSLQRDRESDQLQARVQWLSSKLPDREWLDLSDQQLLADPSWLEPYLIGISKSEQLKRVSLLDIFKNMLGWDRLQLLDREAPVIFTVPSGSKIRIEYRPDEPPVLAVRIQEMFGLYETPRICMGTVPLLLHLLSPARRPIQVTSDLSGFWQRGYPEVKKELKGRYPKHYWPDDPLEAEATRSVKRKK